MKPKKLNNKLTLNKKNIANLNNSDMNVVKGGEQTDGPEASYITCFVTCAYSCAPQYCM